MLASKGEALPPCGVPSSLHDHCPSSSTPAFSHLRMSRTTRWSATRCSMNLISHSWSRPSKNELMSPSSTHSTFLVSNAVYKASSAWCGLLPGPVAIREPEKVSLIDSIQHHDS